MSTVELPLWLQDIAYPARVDRGLIDAIWPNEAVIRGLQVTKNAGQPFAVDVSPGYAVILGDAASSQGKFLGAVRATTTLTLPAIPSSGSRFDRIILRVYDPDAGQTEPTAGTYAYLEVVQGTAAPSSPVPPVIPTSSISLASVAMVAGTSAISPTGITDERPSGPAGALMVTISPDPPPPTGTEGSIWIQVAP